MTAPARPIINVNNRSNPQTLALTDLMLHEMENPIPCFPSTVTDCDRVTVIERSILYLTFIVLHKTRSCIHRMSL